MKTCGCPEGDCTKYKLTEAPAYVQRTHDGQRGSVEHPLWSGTKAPPPIGGDVDVTMNGFGPGRVQGYFVEHGFLGMYVEVFTPPQWWRKQTKDLWDDPVRAKNQMRGCTMVYGAEVKLG